MQKIGAKKLYENEQKGRMNFLLTILHTIFGVLTFGLAIFSLITKNFEYRHFMLLSMSLMFLIMGIKEFRKEKKATAYSLVLVSVFALIVAIQGFILF